MSFINYYDILGLTRTASTAEIRSSWRTLVLQLHPDRHIEGSALQADNSEQFRLVQEAYEVLTDPAHRVVFDRQLRGGNATVMAAHDFYESLNKNLQDKDRKRAERQRKQEKKQYQRAKRDERRMSKNEELWILSGLADIRL